MGLRRVLGVLLLGFMLATTACQSTDSRGVVTESGASGENAADDSGQETPDVEPVETTDSTEAAETTTSSTATAVPAEPEVDETSDVAPPAGQTQVRLLDAGAEPRSVLRIQVPDGTTQIMVMEQRQKLVQEVAGQALQEVETAIIMRAEVVSNVIDGGYRLTSTAISAEAAPDADPATADQVTEALQVVVGLTTSGTIDDRGNALSEAEVTGTEALDPALGELVQSVSQLTAPLPEEAVGVGASWEVIQPIDLDGLEILQSTTYTVDAIDGSIVRLTTTTEQQVDAGASYELGGVTIEVVSWDIVGDGTVELDLQSIVPVSSATSGGVQELGAADEPDTLVQRINISLETSVE